MNCGKSRASCSRTTARIMFNSAFFVFVRVAAGNILGSSGMEIDIPFHQVERKKIRGNTGDSNQSQQK